MTSKTESIAFDYESDKKRFESLLSTQIFFRALSEEEEEEADFRTISDLPVSENILYGVWCEAIKEIASHLCAWCLGAEWSADGRKAVITVKGARYCVTMLCRHLLTAIVCRMAGVPIPVALDEELLLHRLRTAFL